MKSKREKVERITVDPLVLDHPEMPNHNNVKEKADNEIAVFNTDPSEKSAEKENYIKQAFLALINGEWESAEEYCDKELSRNPNSADAYLGKLMAELHVSKEELLAKCAAPFDKSENYIGIRRSGNQEVLARVNGYLRQILERQKEKLYVEAKKVMESAKTKEDYQRAEALFGKIASYKDASKLQKECQKIIKKLGEGKQKRPVDWKKIVICVVIALAAAVVAGIVFGGIQWYRHHIGSSNKNETTATTVVTEADTTEPTTLPPTTTTKPAETTTESNILNTGICGDISNAAGEQSVTWTLDNKGVMTIAGSGKMASSYNEKSPPWNAYKTTIKELVVREGITYVSSYAFQECKKLSSVNFASGITEIGENAFEKCTALKTVYLPSTLELIYPRAFAGCIALSDISIPDSVKAIGDSAFRECSSLSIISFPKKAIVMGSSVFRDSAWYDAQPDGCIYIGTVLLTYKGSMPKGTSLIVQEGTTVIADQAFFDKQHLVDISFPDSLEYIGDFAFSNCVELTNITIPDGV